jgi:anti-anti-sigma factor
MSRCKILQAECSGVYVLKLEGEVRLNLCSTIDAAIESMTMDPNFATIVVDLSETTLIDSTTLGLLAKLAILAKQKSHFLPSIVSTNPDITRIITTMGFDSVYLIMNEPATSPQALVELSPKDMNETELRENVLNAHKILMELNEHNREQFKDLVATLEGDVDEHTSHVG